MIQIGHIFYTKSFISCPAIHHTTVFLVRNFKPNSHFYISLSLALLSSSFLRSMDFMFHILCTYAFLPNPLNTLLTCYYLPPLLSANCIAPIQLADCHLKLPFLKHSLDYDSIIYSMRAEISSIYSHILPFQDSAEHMTGAQ